MIAIDNFIRSLANVILNPLIRLMFAAAVIYFLWGVFIYIMNADSEEKRREGGQHIMWGLIGLVIMMGVYGILRIATGTIFGL
jgi:FtsH-binding integral membrane protein